MGVGRGLTGRKVHSRLSESGVGGVGGDRRSGHERLASGQSGSSPRRLPPASRRFVGLKLDARSAIGDRLRRVVYLRA